MIKELFEHYARERRFKTVAEILNADGYRTENGAMLTGQTVSRILKDQRHLDNGTITQNLWDECGAILNNIKSGNAPKRRVAHLCSGLITCACGQTMYVPTNSKKYVCSKCRNKIAKDDLEMIILDHFRNSDSEELQQVSRQWSTLSFSQKREILEAAVSGIKADSNKVTLTLIAIA